MYTTRRVLFYSNLLVIFFCVRSRSEGSLANFSWIIETVCVLLIVRPLQLYRHVPRILSDLLTDPNILKIGHSHDKNDFKKLNSLKLKIDPVFDISDFAKRLGFRRSSLKHLAANLFGMLNIYPLIYTIIYSTIWYNIHLRKRSSQMNICLGSKKSIGSAFASCSCFRNSYLILSY